MKCIFEENTICRLCLRVDEKVFKLNSKHHKDFIETIINLKNYNNVPTEDHYVCYICNALIIKTHSFVQTIWNAQKIICDILKNSDTVTKPMLEHIDRHGNSLNPITLSSVLIPDSEICEKGDINTNIEFEEETEEESMQHQANKENFIIMKIGNNSTDEIYDLISNSDKDIMESDDCYLDEVVSGDPLEEKNTIVRKRIKKDLSMEACEGLKPGRKKKMQATDKKSKPLKKKCPAPQKTKNSSSTKKVIKPKDLDYEPDSTSHSEDSEYDSFDDEGKRIKKPKDGRSYPRQCDHCNYEVPKRADHFRHYLFLHPNIEYPYKTEQHTCSICGKLVASAHLKWHEENHKKQEFKCPLCPKVFSSKLRVYSHGQSVHPKKTYTCDYCSKIFKTRSDICRHFRIHTGSKPYKCHICGDEFAHSGNRLIHIRGKHQNIKTVKKQSHKVRDKQETTSSDDEPLRSTKENAKTKKLRRRKNRHENTDVTLKKKNKSAKLANSNRKAVSNDRKRKQRKKKPQMTSDHDGTNLDTQNIDGDHNNRENAEIDSDDDVLIMIKKRRRK